MRRVDFSTVVIRDARFSSLPSTRAVNRDVPKVGDLVKPARGVVGGPWRLGVVEAVCEDGRYRVCSYVAPPKSYEGSSAAYSADELVVVPRARVIAYLDRVRMEAEAVTLLATQITNALRVVERGLVQCECGGSAGDHHERCRLARLLREG